MLEALASSSSSRMPASLGSDISIKDQQQQLQQQQQQSNSLQYNISNNSIKTTSIIIDSLLSSSSSSSNATNNNITLQNESISTNKMKLLANNGDKPDPDLINSKFNELAKKILEELKQTQYSREFFKTIDDIIKEPSGKSVVPSNCASRREKYHKKYQELLNRQQQQIVQQQQQIQLLSKDRLQTKASQTDQQPRSLPVDVSTSLQEQQQKQKSQLEQQKQSIARHDINSDLKSSSPSNNNDQVIVLNGQISRVSNNSPNRNNRQSSQNSYPLSRSATAVESMQNNAKRQETVPRKPSPNGVSSPNQENCENIRSSNNNNNNQYLYRRHKNYSAGSVSNSHVKRSTIGNRNNYDSDDDNEDDDDDDDDDDDADADNGRSISPANKSRGNYQNSRFNPISKSKTLSDSTNISEINMLTKQQHSPRQQQQQNYHHQQYLQPNQKQPLQQQRFIKSTVASNTNNIQHDQQGEPKSLVLNSKDIGSLYRPHMNYSTSVLGSHRLSDDDEIIIIPTQSPSLVSNSPDPDQANADELTERFSISRTKSFWEKLSKGNHGKRANQVSSADNPSIKANKQIAHDSNNNHYINHNYHRQQQQQQPQHQQQLQHQQYNINGNKIIGVRLNGHSNTLDRMDSTGGSNSNYSCSSSGDENGAGSHTQQNPAVSQLEMSRENRLRQTR